MQINLLPDVVLARRRDAQIKQWAALGLVAWFGLMVLLALGAFAYRQLEKQWLSSAQTTQAQLSASVNSTSNVAFRQEALEVQNSLQALDQLFNHQIKTSLITGRVAELTPKEVQLQTISIGSDASVDISGTADSYDDAGKMVVALKDSQSGRTDNQVYFDDVVFGGANIAQGGVSFTIKAQYVYPNSIAASSNAGGGQ